MSDEQEKTDKENITSTSTAKTDNVKKDLQGKGGGTGGNGTPTKSTASTVGSGEVVVNDPMVNIGCKQPGGILIDLPSRAAFKLNCGFNRHNKSIWGMIEASGQYDKLIEAGIIYLSKNG